MTKLTSETVMALALLGLFGTTQAFIISSQGRLAATEEEETAVHGASSLTTAWSSGRIAVTLSTKLLDQGYLERHRNEVTAAQVKWPPQ